MRNKRFFYLLIMTALLLGFSACKSTRFLSRQRQQNTLVQEVLEQNERIDKLEAKWTLQMAQGLKVSGLLNMGPTSLWISVTPFLGIETHRLYWSKELIQFYDRSQKAYASDSVKNIQIPDSEQYLNLLTGIFSNQIVTPAGHDYSLEDFEFYFDENKMLHLTYEDNGQKWNYSINEKGEYTDLNIQQEDVRILSVHYADFQNIGGLSFPCEIQMGSDLLSSLGGFTIYLNEISFNKEVRQSFNTPRNYDKIDITVLLKSLSLCFETRMEAFYEQLTEINFDTNHNRLWIFPKREANKTTDRNKVIKNVFSFQTKQTLNNL